MPKKTNNTKLPKIKKLPSGSYHCKVYSHTDENGKQVFESFTDTDYNALVLAVAEYKKERTEEKKRIRDTGGTLQEYCRKYLNTKSNILSPSTVRSYTTITEKKMPNLMKMPMNSITQEDIQREINTLAKTLSPKTLRNYHGFITTVIYFYRPEVKFNTSLPQKVKPDIIIPTEDEIKIIFDAAKNTPAELPILLAACCGLRASEIAGLKWNCVGENTLTVKEAKVRDSENNLVSKTTKTTAGKRTIRLYPFVAARIAAMPKEGEYVTSLSPIAMQKRFARILEKTGVRHFRFHDLRHYCVSVMLSLNIPKSYIADYMGHQTEHMVETVYGHIMASRKTSAEDQLQEYFEKIFSQS